MENRKRGRVAADGAVGVTRANVGLTEDMWEYVNQRGNGNVSVGLRAIVSDAMTPQKVQVVRAETTPRKKVVKSVDELWDEYCDTLDYTPNIIAERKWKAQHRAINCK